MKARPEWVQRACECGAGLLARDDARSHQPGASPAGLLCRASGFLPLIPIHAQLREPVRAFEADSRDFVAAAAWNWKS